MDKSILSADRARELFSYDPITGSLTWKVSNSNRVKVGAEAGFQDAKGYIRIRVDSKLYLAHRVVWLIVTGTWPTQVIDHKSGNTSDNRFLNLRDVSRQTNQENHRNPRKGSETGSLGVSLKRGKFRARIRVAGVEIYLGMHPTVDAAHEVYLTAKRELHVGCTI